MTRETATVAGGAALLTLLSAALLLATGDLIVALAPGLAVAALWAVWKLPLRYTLFALTFLVLAVDARGNSVGQWSSPLQPIGTLLQWNLNLTIPIDALKFTGVDAIVVLLGVLVVWRRATHARIDRTEVSTARPMAVFCLLALGSIALISAYGAATGGDVNQIYWQVHQLALIPVIGFLFQAALRGPRDHATLGLVIVAAALCKAAMAMWVRLTVHLPNGAKLSNATSHADSILFACAVAIVLALLLEAPTRKYLTLAALTLPPLAGGMIANNRRIVWVEVACVALLLYAMSPWTRLKRAIGRAVVLSLPLLALYTAAGWHSGSRLFLPVQIARSVMESKTDRSTETREVENFNLLTTLRTSPLLGIGYGHEYIEVVKGDDISKFFPQYRYVPHNSLLGLWAFSGLAGFTGVWLMLVVCVFFAARAYHRSRAVKDRAAALACVAAVLVYALQCWGDMGLGAWTGVFTVGPATAVAARLAVACRGWPVAVRAAGAVPAGAPA